MKNTRQELIDFIQWLKLMGVLKEGTAYYNGLADIYIETINSAPDESQSVNECADSSFKNKICIYCSAIEEDGHEDFCPEYER